VRNAAAILINDRKIYALQIKAGLTDQGDLFLLFPCLYQEPTDFSCSFAACLHEKNLSNQDNMYLNRSIWKFNTCSVILTCLLIIFLLAPGLSAQQKYMPPAGDRLKTNIDFGWRFINRDFPHEEETHQVNELPWRDVNLPHEWSIEGPFDENNNTTQGFLPMEIGWYRKGLHFPDSYAGKKIFIIFDGVYRSSDVWMNYAYLGHHESGYTSFMYDLTDYVRLGNRIPNGLRVRVDGRRHEEDMYEGTGIYRHAWILVTNKLHMAEWGTFISAPEISDEQALIRAETLVKNENDRPLKCRLITTIVDHEGFRVAEMKSSATITANGEYNFVQTSPLGRPHRWDIDDPYLYKAYSVLSDGEEVVDVTETPFGVRTYHFDPERGFFLNGRHVKLKGFNAHYDFAGLGTAIPDRIQWNVMTAMKKAGFNFYRSSHNPATPERLDVCDRIGMLVWDEIERKLESKEVELPLVRETITRDRNHPSIILWSLENESPLESTIFGTEIISAATALAHQLDPTRLTTFAASMPVNKNGYGEAIDVVSYNYHWKRSDQDHIDFPHWKIGLLSEYSASRSRRGVYGVENFARADNDSYLDLYWGMVQSMYEMCTSVESYWRRIKARDYLAGGCLWSGMDCWGEGNAWPLISRGDGAVDACLFPKDVYYYFVSMWTGKPMLHVFPHWTWTGNEDKPVEIWCYTNCDSAELFLNNQSFGRRSRAPEPAPWSATATFAGPPEKSETFPEHLVWQVPYQAGTIKVNGFNKDKLVCSQEIHTAGPAEKIELSVMMDTYLAPGERPALIADGRDIICIRAAVLDRQGNLIPTAANLITFSINGPGKIIGVGNGDIASHEPAKSNQRKAYNGLCMVIVQSTAEAGDISIRAESTDLGPGEMKITSTGAQPVNIVLEAESLNLAVNDTLSVTAFVRDKFGCVVSSAEPELQFRINGAGYFDNGKKSILVASRNGKAVARFRSDESGGVVIIEADGKELKPGKITISAK